MFNFFKKKKSIYLNKPIPLNLSKVESLDMLNLRKDVLKDVVYETNLNTLKSKVGLVLDFSGSMSFMYKNGTVQALIERLIPLALRFDDNAELDFWIFENGFKRLEPITLNNFHNIAKELLKNYNFGGTNYAPVMQDVIKKYTIEESSEIPAYIMFITDGDNFDKNETTKLIKESCMENIFWQFVGIGEDSMDYLEKLDDMRGRKRDSVDFFKVEKINHITDESLYENLLNEFPNWVHNLK